jgi:acid stress chaperone HdeB
LAGGCDAHRQLHARQTSLRFSRLRTERKKPDENLRHRRPRLDDFHGRGPAEKIDFSTMTCKQFLQSSKDGIGLIPAWLDGYYHDEKDPPVFDTEKFQDNAKMLAQSCVADPELGLITVADKLFGK